MRWPSPTGSWGMGDCWMQPATRCGLIVKCISECGRVVGVDLL